jgi:predicted DNA-binding antitoxin AbrB/MazE fold protein
MQTYEGYFENDHFHPIGKPVRLPEGRRAIVTILDEPVRGKAEKRRKKAKSEKPTEAERIAKMKAAFAEIDRMAKEAEDEELDMSVFQRNKSSRPPIIFMDEE